VLALRCAVVWEVPRLEAGDDLDESLRQLPGTQVRKVREEDDRHWASLCRQPSVLEAQRMMRHASSIKVSSCKLQHNRTLSDFQPGTFNLEHVCRTCWLARRCTEHGHTLQQVRL